MSGQLINELFPDCTRSEPLQCKLSSVNGFERKEAIEQLEQIKGEGEMSQVD